jgi:predicted Zn-dependent protease
MMRAISPGLVVLLAPLLGGVLAVGPALGDAAVGTRPDLAVAAGAASAADAEHLMAALDRCLDRELPTAEATATCDRAAARASELDSGERAALLHRRGEIELSAGRSAAATVLLEQARQQEPTVAPYALTLGDALVASGAITRAIAVYREGQALAPAAKVFRTRLEALGAVPKTTPPAVAQR